jgi:hypothetical protein
MAATQAEPQPSLVNALDDPETSAQLVFAWRRQEVTTFPWAYRVELVDLAETVVAEFRKYATAGAKVVDAGNSIEYDPEYRLRQGECFVLTRDEWPGGDLFTQLESYLTLPRFAQNLTKPRLYVLAVSSRTGNAFFGKTMGALQVLNRTKGAFSAIWDGSTFNALAESMATFSKSFDWVIWQDKLFVLNAAGFHAEFRDNEAIKRAVSEHVAAITSGTLQIRNSEALISRCQMNVALAAKLKHIAEQGIQQYDVATLKKYSADYGIAVN